MSRLKLVPPISDFHAASWLEWRNQPESRRYNPFDDQSLESLKSRLAMGGVELDKVMLRAEPGEYRRMAILQETGEVIGTASLGGINRRMKTAELGYQLGAEFHARGLGTEMVRLFLDEVFRSADLRRVTALVHVENVASCRLLERLGFSKEGVLREHYLVEGVPADEVHYGLLRREWASRERRT